MAGEPVAPSDHARLDRWLWAARFFKTRALASAAIEGGRVDVNGDRPKPAKTIHPGDVVSVRLGPYEHVVTVRALSVRRGPAAAAAQLYEEDPAGRVRRERLAEQHKVAAQAFGFGEGKPTRQERRATRRLKGKD